MSQGFASQRLGVNISAGTGLAQTGTVVLSNANGVSFGMQNSASSLVVTASMNQPAALSFLPGRQEYGNGNITPGVAFVQRLQPAANMNITALAVQIQNPTVGGTQTCTIRFGVYTMSGSTASLQSSASNTLTISGQGNTASVSYAFATLPTIAISPGDYLFYGALSFNANGVIVLTTGTLTVGNATVPWFNDGWVTNTAVPSSIHVSNVAQTLPTVLVQANPLITILGS